MIELVFLSSPATPLAQKILKYPVVEHQPKSSFWEAVGVLRRRSLRAAVRRQPWLNRFLRAKPNTVYFPALDTSQRWRKNLYWIPDFQHHYLPHLFEPTELAWRDRNFSAIANSPGVLLLSSQSALTDFQTFYPAATVQPRVWSFCSTIRPGPEADCQPALAAFDLPPKFLYVANQFWRHKDHITVFAALNLLKQQGLTIPLVCTGKQDDRRDPAYIRSLLDNLDQHSLRDQVYLLGVVPRQTQIQLLRAAAAVVQPSRFEGWSTVIEDAKALGRPIIASDFAVHREQLHNYAPAWHYATGEPDALAQCLTQAWVRLAQGPDPEGEAEAAKRNQTRRLELAHQFMAIAKDAMICSALGRPL
ncbi:glycosyltransferase [Nodosilinea sp. LEGE 07088]|uniref:glycosyltransferase n=1 Tax=Nodosilinea sp. LEGE 07088 TaxID=2777968 RepID=UPI001D149208|nr:glycosyltransferase [Nodosilinea sp. LEGE 07088]